VPNPRGTTHPEATLKAALEHGAPQDAILQVFRHNIIIWITWILFIFNKLSCVFIVISYQRRSFPRSTGGFEHPKRPG